MPAHEPCTLQLPARKAYRKKDTKYKYKTRIVIWDGIILRCPHYRERKHCHDCGGVSICVHRKRRSRCRQCRGVSICKHGRVKYSCVPCKGNGICMHNRLRQTCVPCLGSSICQHKRQRHECKDCKGSSICKHNRVRNQCKACNGTSICVHKRQRNKCVKCDGASICEHKTDRSKCKECHGSCICLHNRLRHLCKDCKGTSICEHNRRRALCKNCNGQAICNHQRQRRQCHICDQPKHPQHWCKLCKMVNVRYSRYDGYCYNCFAYTFPDDARVKRRLKLKELELYRYLQVAFPNVDIRRDKTLFDGCSKYRPDFVIDLGYVILIIECDEQQHSGSSYACEMKRALTFLSDAKRPVTIFRFNPDAYIDQHDLRYSSCFSVKDGKVNMNTVEWARRTTILNEALKPYFEHDTTTDPPLFQQTFLFYNAA